MKIGIAGLGRMGGNMARRLARAGLTVVAWNRDQSKVAELVSEEDSRVEGCAGLAEMAAKLSGTGGPRVVWLMLPAGGPTEDKLAELSGLLAPGDVVVDGANGRWRDAVRHASFLAGRGIHFLDVGVSGGVWGLENGYCMMVGGPAAVVEVLRPVLDALAPAPARPGDPPGTNGWLHCGEAGAGHFVKMVHNGIEYGMMQAYAEGFALMEASEFGPGLDFKAVGDLWNRGSVVRSWLLELAAEAFGKDARLTGLEAFVQDSGEGRWTVEECVNLAVPAPVMTAALFERFRSRQENSFADRLLAALRREFGGHAVKAASSSDGSRSAKDGD